jgi:protein-S-isoprenylcysteine O-methyltransferase Ste14
MPTAPTIDPLAPETGPGTLARIGGWLFRRRSWLPAPIAALLLTQPPSPVPLWVPAVGVGLVAAGEVVRLWGVRHIGVISRTRSDRLGPLVASGPFRHVRNPLYLGNVLLWLGFALCAQLLWLAPIIVAVLAAQYHAIVVWEEGLLRFRLGRPYLDYLARVPRWVPTLRTRIVDGGPAVAYSWRDTLYSERGTLLTIALGYLLLALKRMLAVA